MITFYRWGANTRLWRCHAGRSCRASKHRRVTIGIMYSNCGLLSVAPSNASSARAKPSASNCRQATVSFASIPPVLPALPAAP